MICCDTCPYFPTCEEVDDFKREVLGWDEEAIADEIGWGEEAIADEIGWGEVDPGEQECRKPTHQEG